MRISCDIRQKNAVPFFRLERVEAAAERAVRRQTLECIPDIGFLIARPVERLAVDKGSTPLRGDEGSD